MKKLLIIILTIGLLLMAVGPVWADFAKDQWQFKKEISSSTSGKYGLITIDGEIFNHSNKQLSDLRIIDLQGKEVPYYLTNQQAPSVSDFQSKLLNNSVLPGEYTSFIVNVQNLSGTPYDRLSIDTTSKDFLRRVELEGSKDQKNWQQIDKDQIYSVQGQMNTTIKFGLSNFPFLKVKIWNKTETPLEITGVRVFAANEAPVVQPKVIPNVKMSQSEDGLHQKSVLRLDLGYNNMPSTQVNLIINDINFQRQVEISGSNDGQKWFALGNDVIYATNIDDYKFKKVKLNYQESWYRYLRLTIYNQDNQPLKVTGAEVLGKPKKLIFPLEGDNSYQIYYGNPKAQVPQYDLQESAKYLQLNNLPLATLGPEKANPKFNVRTQRPWTEDNNWLLICTLVLVVAVLGGFIIKLMKNIGKEDV